MMPKIKPTVGIALLLVLLSVETLAVSPENNYRNINNEIILNCSDIFLEPWYYGSNRTNPFSLLSNTSETYNWTGLEDGKSYFWYCQGIEKTVSVELDEESSYFSDPGWSNPENCVDENWDTYGTPPTGGGSIFEEFSKPDISIGKVTITSKFDLGDSCLVDVDCRDNSDSTWIPVYEYTAPSTSPTPANLTYEVPESCWELLRFSIYTNCSRYYESKLSFYQRLDITSGLVGYWRFEEGSGSTAYDFSGQGNNGTIYGAKFVQGVYNHTLALSFDGVGDYVEVPDSESLHFNGSDTFTITGWFRLNVLPSERGSNEAIISKSRDFLVRADAVDDKLHFFVYDGTDYRPCASTTTVLRANRWYFFAAVYDVGTLKIFLDDELEGTETNTKAEATTNPIRLGYWASGEELNGTIDEVRIYNRSLNEEEIQLLYNITRVFHENEEPTVTNASISPDIASSYDEIYCFAGAFDKDDDTLTTTCDWNINGVWSIIGDSDCKLSPGTVSVGDNVSCRIYVTDGYETTQADSEQITIQNYCLTPYLYQLYIPPRVKFWLPAQNETVAVNLSALDIPAEKVKVSITNVDSPQVFFDQNQGIIWFNVTANESSILYVLADLDQNGNTQSGITLNTSLSYPASSSAYLTSDFTRVNARYDLGIYSATDLTEFDYSATNQTILKVHCPSATTSADLKAINQTDLIIATETIPDILRIYVDQRGASYFRDQVPESEVEDINFYLVNLDVASLVLIKWVLKDYTHFYEQGILTIKRYINSTLIEETSGRFEADNTLYTYLLPDMRYSLSIKKGSSVKSLGWVTITPGDFEKTITIYGTSLEYNLKASFFDNVKYTITANESYICFSYEDAYQETEWVYWAVMNTSNEAILYEDNVTASSYSGCYLVPVSNQSYYVRIVFAHPRGSVVEIGTVVQAGVVALLKTLEFTGEIVGLSNKTFWLIVGLMGIACFGLAFGALESRIGAILIVVFTLIFSYFGWLPLMESFTGKLIIFILLILAFVVNVRK